MGNGRGHRSFLERPNFNNLDGVRALCIGAVLYHHFMPYYPNIPITHRGFLGVDMFFVVSGFLIVFLLLRERDRTGKISLANFYARRTLRIFPLYYLIVLLVGMASLVFDRGTFSWSSYTDVFPYLITYTLNWTTREASILDVAWSLATEEQFYLVWPFIIALFSKRAALGALAFAIVINLGISFGVRSELKVMQSTFLPILLGVGLAYLLHHRRTYDAIARVLARPYATVTLTAVILVVLGIPNDDIRGLHRTAVQLLFVPWLASVLVSEAGVGHRLLRLPFLVRTGRISYGLYLWHMVGYVVASRFVEEPAGLRLAVVGIAVSFVLAELSYRYFETPFLRMKSRFNQPAPRATITTIPQLVPTPAPQAIVH